MKFDEDFLEVEESNLMKKIFRFLSVGFLLMAFIAITGTVSKAQAQDEKTDTYNKFLQNYNKQDIPSIKIALDAAKQYIEKYPDDKEQVDYLTKWIPAGENKIKELERQARYNRFDTAFKASNFDEAYAAGKDILASEPDNLDLILALGSIGYDQSLAKNNKYNDDTIRYAKLAIEKLKSGATSKNYGLKYTNSKYNYQYNNKDNAIGWMNLYIGSILYNAQNNKKDALPYLYAAAQANSETKSRPDIFDSIGAYYFEDVTKLGSEIQALIKEQQAMPATATDEEKAKKDAEIKAKIAILNGTTERAMDAYGRAYNIVKANPKNKDYADRLYKRLQTLYDIRFNKSTGLDEYIASTTAKPMPDPATAITPVTDPEPTPVSAGTTSTATPVAEKPAAPAGSTAKAAAATAAPSDSTTATKAKPVTTTKKPVVVKKKGTR